MRKLKQLIRLHYQANLSNRDIAHSLNISVGAVNKYIHKFEALEQTSAELLLLDEGGLQAVLRNKTISEQEAKPPRHSIAFASIHQELKHKGMTLQLLWEEYTQSHDNPLSYSRFCFHYRQWKSSQPSSMRQTHKAGDKVFVDYSGQTVDIIDPDTGNIRSAEIFIGVLGASSFTFAEATWSQSLPDWISSHQHMFDYFGGVCALIVLDNLKSGVSKTCRYEPDINPTYSEFAEHYDCAVLPARPYKPKDKAKVENGVQLVQRWILARLRHQTFVGLAELNQAIRQLLYRLNDKPFKKLPGSRRSQFESIDKPAMRPMPSMPYEFRYYKKAKVNIDYHVELEGHYYSVPYQYCREYIELRYNSNNVWCYFQGQCIATHLRSSQKGAHSTVDEHMTTAHRKQAQWTPERITNWAQSIGSSTLEVTKHLLASKKHPEQAYRTCLGLLSLAKRYGNDRLEAACAYACERGTKTRKSIVSILEHGFDKQQPILQPEIQFGDHANVRGSSYYH